MVRALLACGFAILLAWLSGTRLSHDLLPLGAAAAAWVGGLVFLLPPFADGARRLTAMVLAACGTGGAAIAALFVAGTGFSVQTPVAVALMLYLCAAIVQLVPKGPEPRLAACAWLLFLVVLASAAPVWLGPAIDRLQPDTDAVNALIALNPLTHLAVLADIDYLRSDWFYRNSPLGGLRYDYPPPSAVLAGYLIACLLASAAILLTRGKPGNADEAETPKSLYQQSTQQEIARCSR